MDKTDTLGIYIHIPFCRSKCPYCDFYSELNKEKSEAYIESLICEIKTLSRMSEYVSAEAKKRTVDTVYFGGGTPSVLKGTQIKTVIDTLKQEFNFSGTSEITVECNPSSENFEEFIDCCYKAGVNRISLGMQSAVDNERHKLGRKADREKIKQRVEFIKSVGINNISLDIMLGIPEQTMESLDTTLCFAMSLDVPHISAYILKLEEGTPFYKLQNKLSFANEDTVSDMYLHMCSVFENAGFVHYEISNFCKPSFESRHNTKYWEDREYLGFGPAAHSFYDGQRFYFDSSVDNFINGAKAVYDSSGGDGEEYFMLRLRLKKGVSLNYMREKFSFVPDKNFYKNIDRFVKGGFCEFDSDILRLTDKGMLLSNAIITTLM